MISRVAIFYLVTLSAVSTGLTSRADDKQKLPDQYAEARLQIEGMI